MPQENAMPDAPAVPDGPARGGHRREAGFGCPGQAGAALARGPAGVARRPARQGPWFTGKIEAILAFQEPYANTIAIPLQPSMFAVIPSGKVLPQGLLASIGALQVRQDKDLWINSGLLCAIERCTPDTCQFLAANSDDDPGDEWVLVQDECRSAYVEWLLFDDSSNGYRLLGSLLSSQITCQSVSQRNRQGVARRSLSGTAIALQGAVARWQEARAVLPDDSA
jgi:hypothetical protein